LNLVKCKRPLKEDEMAKDTTIGVPVDAAMREQLEWAKNVYGLSFSSLLRQAWGEYVKNNPNKFSTCKAVKLMKAPYNVG